MKVKELITTLQQFDGELEVYGMCDHGHAPERIRKPSILWAETGVHTLWEDFTTDEEEAAEEGYEFKAVLL